MKTAFMNVVSVRTLAVLAVVAVALVAIGIALWRPAAQPTATLSTLPELELPAISDDIPGIDSSQLAIAPITIINVFASWCVPCIAEMPLLEQLAQTFRVIGITWLDRPEDTQQFLAQYGNPFEAIGASYGDQSNYQLGIFAIPVTMIIDQDRKILFRHEGPLTERDVNLILQNFGP